jgi:hypothetical protein
VRLDGPAALRAERDLVEARDLALALHARRVIGRQPVDQGSDAVTQVQGEVRGGGAHQLAHVVDGRLAVKAVGPLELTHLSRLSRARHPAGTSTTTVALRVPYGAFD